MGGRPWRSKVRRRISVRRSASGRGRRPSASSRARMNASTGVRTQSGSRTAGTGGRSSGRKAHHISPSNRRDVEHHALRPVRARLDPATKAVDLLLRQRPVLLRHLGRVARDHLEQQAFLRLPRHDRRPILAAAKHSLERGQRQPALGRLRTVAVQAALLQDWRNLLAEHPVGLVGPRHRRDQQQDAQTHPPAPTGPSLTLRPPSGLTS